MENFLRSECPHCNQPVEYPVEGTGQTVPCPGCGKPFVLAPFKAAQPPPPAALTIGATAVKPAPAPAKPLPSPAVLPEKDASRPLFSPAVPASPESSAPRTTPAPEISDFEQACRALETDPAFVKHPPTREQIGRAWAWAKFQKADVSGSPSHADLVAAMKKLFAHHRGPSPRTEPKGH